MKLRSHRERENLTLAQMAERIGLDPRTGARTIHRYEALEQIPGRAHMARIYHATGGEVRPNDFYNLPPSNEEAA